MDKLRKREIEEIMNRMGMSFEDMQEMIGIDVYHFHEWDHGYDSHTGYCGARREFYNDFFEMKVFLKRYVELKELTKVIVSPLHQRYYFNAWDECVDDIYNEINTFLENNGIDKRYECGLRFNIDENWKFIDAVCEGAYRDVTNIAFVFEESKTVLIPHHHMNFGVYSYNLQKEKELVQKLIANIPTIEMDCKL